MDEEKQKRTFDDWLAQHRGLIFKVVRAYAFTPPDQDDLFQEIATQIWNSIPQFRGNSAVTTWLYRVALNTALAWLRKERRNRHHLQAISDSEFVLEVPVRATNARLDWLYEQIAQLDHVDRSLTLLMLDGFSYREMAETLGISESHVGVKLNRIKAQLITKSQETRDHEL